MNDPSAPPAVEWFFRIAAVLGMCVVFVFLMMMVLRISGALPPLPRSAPQAQAAE